ncbi:DUF72 domain-containing protein [Saccharopolyspora rhizosphaerae]|uniref:DUF72 domain-containing protein n=1 Tax=Saccharopolyspora rhizosphaerae TaxID=2492662 RepID=A0A3R8P3E7_9PSEU|nr:DUF72 domain-containing protein [Saccharopolyspora rhizosphaerae]RRO15674.1 DUF72 domain-containing protein [Saccharopolyspora rhizosphaerae]
MAGQVRVGTSGWVYGPWHGPFYPEGLRRGQELAHLAERMNSVEINGSFYSLQRPENYRKWAEQTPDEFVFSVKGSRYITHMKRLRDAEVPLANFLASGVLALGDKLGPMLWQLPPTLQCEPDRLVEFFSLLPRSSGQAAELAARHDERLDGRALTETDADRPIRHALEVRHPSFATPEAVDLLREHDIGLVVADAAGSWPYLEDVTSDFVYLRFHGAEELYASGYGEEALRGWAELIQAWRRGGAPTTDHTVAEPAPKTRGRDIYAYFDNDIKAHAPHDAMTLRRLLRPVTRRR